MRRDTVEQGSGELKTTFGVRMDKNGAQRQRPLEIIDQIGRPVRKEWKFGSRGYSLGKPGASQIGFIRFNQRGTFVVYVSQPFSDPKRLFTDTRGGREGKYSDFDPKDRYAIDYVVSVIESAWDKRK